MKETKTIQIEVPADKKAEYAGRQFIDIWADFVFEISDNENEKDDE